MATTETPEGVSAVLILEDGTIYWGHGFGAETTNVAEVCFNTGLTGYQETLTDPSYAGQMITFTFPHIGNVGTNDEDVETVTPAARGLIVRERVTSPSSWRSQNHFDDWLKTNNIPGIYGIDTRALTKRIRDKGAPKGVICVNYSGQFDVDSLLKQAKEWSGLEGLDLAIDVTCDAPYEWNETQWDLAQGYGQQNAPEFHVVAMDFGAKRNILRCLASAGCRVTVVPAQTTAEEILSFAPDGVFLSNGPGDPAATGTYAVPAIQGILQSGLPVFGICLGHQLLSLALGAKTQKMHLGHRGANHPVKCLKSGNVEITSQNHGFCVLEDTLPATAEPSHVSLFDGSNEGVAMKDGQAFSVQYHPEASPGPMDSHYLFERFVDNMRAHKAKKAA